MQHRYIPNTEDDRREMLESIGAPGIEEFLDPIPEEIRLEEPLSLPPALSEKELREHLLELADKNIDPGSYPSFMGGGAYEHYIPSIIDHLISRAEFYTAYTPYQAELSQGILQSMYEYQTMICEITGLDVSNASLYEGGTAVVEAAGMARNRTGREQVLISGTVHPEYREVLATYARGTGFESREVHPGEATRLTPGEVEPFLNAETACLIVQYPNFFGSIEDMGGLARAASGAGAAFIAVTNPISLGLLEPPATFGVDIAVGEGQSLGGRVSYGGPYLGFIAAREEYLRLIPGRLSGATVDQEGKRGFVLALQAREQHIRRGRAASNICSNEALNALMATIYLATMGPRGLREVALQCLQKAHHTSDLVARIPGYEILTREPFFHEFVVSTPRPAAEINEELYSMGLIGGLDLGRFREDWKRRMLVCVTEERTRGEIEEFAASLEVLT